MGNSLDDFYKYLNDNGYEDRSLDIIGMLYEFMNGTELPNEKEKEALSLLYDGFYNSDPLDTWKFAYCPEKKRQLKLNVIKEFANSADGSKEDSVLNTLKVIKKIQDIDDFDYDEVAVYNPDYTLYPSNLTDELEAFFESMDTADDMLRLYLETL